MPLWKTLCSQRLRGNEILGIQGLAGSLCPVGGLLFGICLLLVQPGGFAIEVAAHAVGCHGAHRTRDDDQEFFKRAQSGTSMQRAAKHA